MMYALIIWTWVGTGGMSIGTTYFMNQAACEQAQSTEIAAVRRFPAVNYSIHCYSTDSGQSVQSGHPALTDGLVHR